MTMQPIIDMTTAHSFNQVFFDDVRIPGRSWSVRRATAGGWPRSPSPTSG